MIFQYPGETKESNAQQEEGVTERGLHTIFAPALSSFCKSIVTNPDNKIFALADK